MSQKQIVLHLFRSFKREANKFTSYNFKQYAHRRINAGFRENQSAQPDQVKELIVSSTKDLDMLKRQALINSLYSHNKLVVE
eukprot:gene898-1123_t